MAAVQDKQVLQNTKARKNLQGLYWVLHDSRSNAKLSPFQELLESPQTSTDCQIVEIAAEPWMSQLSADGGTSSCGAPSMLVGIGHRQVAAATSVAKR
jgi:hypothetical protein